MMKMRRSCHILAGDVNKENRLVWLEKVQNPYGLVV
jgi:hypothetical protein